MVSIRYWLILFTWLAAAGMAAAATREWVAQAADLPQIDSITIGGTYVAADTVSVKIGNATLTVTLGSDTTATSTIATAVANAINATDIGAGLVGAESRNAAGQKLGEFRDVEAVIDPANSSVVLVRSKVAGVPFYDVADVSAPYTLAVSKSSTSGTVAAASVQVATGKNWWNNAANWSGAAVPVNNDSIVVANSSASILYGLPAASDNLDLDAVDIDQSFTGQFGLSLINALGYTEYRPRAPAIKDDGATSNSIIFRIGRGNGAGSPLINLSTAFTHASSSATYHIYNTGKPPAGSDYALILDYSTAGTTGADINISGGSIHLKTVDVNDVTINAASAASVLFDAVTVVGGGGAITINGGNVAYRSSGSQTLTVHNGNLSFVGTVPAALNLYGGTATVYNANSGTITDLLVGSGGTFDLSHCTTPLTITNCDLFKGGALLDPIAKGTYTNGIDLDHCDASDVKLEVGTHRRITLGTAN